MDVGQVFLSKFLKTHRVVVNLGKLAKLFNSTCYARKLTRVLTTPMTIIYVQVKMKKIKKRQRNEKK